MKRQMLRIREPKASFVGHVSRDLSFVVSILIRRVHYAVRMHAALTR